MRKLSLVLVVLGLSLILVGCASAPTEEVNATKAAVEAIQNDDVTTYASESLQTAQDNLNKALAEIQTQDAKFALSRDYKAASEMLKAAKDSAEKAKNDAQVNKAQAKADAEALIASLPATLEETKKVLAKAPKGKDTRADLEAMQNDLKLAEESLVEVNTLMSQEKYKDALAKATSIKEKAAAVTEQVQTAMAKVKR
jgi:PBP1b-binding outer membrane lipoprotein LpoB